MTETKGVGFNAPPDRLIPDVHAAIDRALATLEPDHTVALVGVVTDAGVNAALVTKTAHGVKVATWVGKKWGESLAGGAYVMWSH